MIRKLSTKANSSSSCSLRCVAVSTLFLAASATLSRSGRISNVMAMATTASVKNFIRSAVPTICGSAMTGG